LALLSVSVIELYMGRSSMSLGLHGI